MVRPNCVGNNTTRETVALLARLRNLADHRTLPTTVGRCINKWSMLAGELCTCCAPVGETCLAWQRAVAWPVSIKALCRALPDLKAERIAGWLDAGQGAPVS